MKHLFFSLLLVSSFAKAETLSGKYELSKSNVKYLVTYLIKKAESESVESKGKGECKASVCEFLIAAPIKSFVSKDSNRDLNMLSTTKADKYPLAVVRAKTPAEITSGKFNADLEVEFAGVKKVYAAVPFEVKSSGAGFSVHGKFDLKLVDHNVERPSLLGVSIDELVPMTIDAEWKK